jgi:hypothetical protein
MGMIWNSPDTLKFLDKVNKEFSDKYSDWVLIRDLFDPAKTASANELLTIKGNHGPHAGGGFNTALDKKFQKWLNALGSITTSTSAHQQLRTAIYNGLDDKKYTSIFFQLVPLPAQSDVLVEEYADEDDNIMGILIKTPTYDHMKKLVRRKARNRRSARAAATSGKKKT